MKRFVASLLLATLPFYFNCASTPRNETKRAVVLSSADQFLAPPDAVYPLAVYVIPHPATYERLKHLTCVLTNGTNIIITKSPEGTYRAVYTSDCDIDSLETNSALRRVLGRLYPVVDGFDPDEKDDNTITKKEVAAYEQWLLGELFHSRTPTHVFRRKGSQKD